MRVVEWDEEALPSVEGGGRRSGASTRIESLGPEADEFYSGVSGFRSLSLGDSLLSFLHQTQSRTPLPTLAWGEGQSTTNPAHKRLPGASRRSSGGLHVDDADDRSSLHFESSHFLSQSSSKRNKKGRDCGEEKGVSIRGKAKQRATAGTRRDPFLSQQKQPANDVGRPQGCSSNQVALLRQLPTSLLLNHSRTFARKAREYLEGKIREHLRLYRSLSRLKKDEGDQVRGSRSLRSGVDTSQSRPVETETRKDGSSSDGSLQVDDPSTQKERFPPAEDVLCGRTKEAAREERVRLSLTGLQPLIISVNDTREEVLLLQKILPRTEGEELSRAILHIKLNPIPLTKVSFGSGAVSFLWETETSTRRLSASSVCGVL